MIRIFDPRPWLESTPRYGLRDRDRLPGAGAAGDILELLAASLRRKVPHMGTQLFGGLKGKPPELVVVIGLGLERIPGFRG